VTRHDGESNAARPNVLVLATCKSQSLHASDRRAFADLASRSRISLLSRKNVSFLARRVSRSWSFGSINHPPASGTASVRAAV
jgi:hypothetical protein